MAMRCGVPRSLGTAAAKRSPGNAAFQHHRSAGSQPAFANSTPKGSTRPQQRLQLSSITFATGTTVVPSPSYAIPISLAGIATVAWIADVKALAGVAGVLGVFLAIQASRVKFIFDDEALEVVIGERDEKTENAFVGGENRWNYSTFVNWEYWWPGFPVLVYFKETQTKPEGQIHFFPIIFNGTELYDVMKERCGETQNSGPK